MAQELGYRKHRRQSTRSERGAKLRLWTGLLLSAAVFGCAGIRTYSNAASGAAQNSPTPVSSPVAVGYKNFVSAKWMYSLQYPETWYEFPVYQGNGLDTMKSFANENIASPEGMDSDGVFVTITVDSSSSKPCTEPPGANDPTVATASISVDGERTTKYLFVNGVGVAVSHNQWCYRFLILTSSTQTGDKYNTEIVHLLSSFKFNR